MSNKKPKISARQVYREIAKRTHTPVDVVSSIVQAYGEIVEQCLKNKIQISLGRVGTFSYKEVPPMDYTEWLGNMSGKDDLVIYWQKEVAGYSKPKFTFSTSCRQRINNATRVPYGTAESIAGYSRVNDTAHERIDYKEYLKKTNYNRYLLLFEDGVGFEPEDYKTDDYDLITLEEEENDEN